MRWPYKVGAAIGLVLLLGLPWMVDAGPNPIMVMPMQHGSGNQMHLDDSVQLTFGNTAAAPDVWFDNNGTSFCLTTTDVGAGVDGDIFCYTLGGAATTVFGGHIDLGAFSRRLIFDTDDDTYLYAWKDDGIQLTVGNSAAIAWSTTAGMVSYMDLTQRDDVETVFGTNDDYWIKYDSTGTNLEIVSNNGDGGGTDVDVLTIQDGSAALLTHVHTVTIADSGDGADAAETVLPRGNLVNIICNDAQGCGVTMSEAAPVTSGQQVVIHIDDGGTSPDVDFTDTDGVSNLSASHTLLANDTLSLVYMIDEWVEVGVSDN